MATNVNNIATQNWTLSIADDGDLLTDLADVNQCILLILNTVRGSSPLRPEFGTEIWKWIDKPMTLAIPNIKREILENVPLWENRAQIVAIGHDVSLANIGQLTFEIKWKFLITGETGITNFNVRIKS